MFVVNIPRRKIYEKMLEYEEHVMEIQILARNKESFDKYKDKYPDSIKNVMVKYKEIKTLLVMFFENKVFETEEKFEGSLKYFLINEKEVNSYLQKRKTLTVEFKTLMVELDKIFDTQKEFTSYDLTKKLFDKLDSFNSQIPEILQIRREDMK